MHLSLSLQLLPGSGLNLDFFNASSLIACAVIALILIGTTRIPVENLLLPLFPLGALTVLLAQFAPAGTSQPINEAPGILAHILLSILAYGLLTIAVLQALLLSLQDHQLKHKHPVRHDPQLPTAADHGEPAVRLPVGRLGRCCRCRCCPAACSSTTCSPSTWCTRPCSPCLAWVVFGVLLWGRHQLGWRGRQGDPLDPGRLPAC